jgi:hypothetical protein
LVVRLLAPVDLLVIGAVPIAFFSAKLLRSVDREFGHKPLALTAAPPQRWTSAGRLKFAAAFLGGCIASSMLALWASARFF